MPALPPVILGTHIPEMQPSSPLKRVHSVKEVSSSESSESLKRAPLQVGFASRISQRCPNRGIIAGVAQQPPIRIDMSALRQLSVCDRRLQNPVSLVRFPGTYRDTSEGQHNLSMETR